MRLPKPTDPQARNPHHATRSHFSEQHDENDSTELPLVTRRELFADSAAIGAGLAAAVLASDKEVNAEDQSSEAAGNAVSITLRVNGKQVPMTIDTRTTLLDAIRNHAGLTGAKKGCDHGQCGACTVHIDGNRIVSCLTLAIMHQRHDINTIEGLAAGDALHPMQAAFLKYDAMQCGFCTPGQIMSAICAVEEGYASTDADIREQMSGNICRCGAYPNIVAAVREVQEGSKNAAV